MYLPYERVENTPELNTVLEDIKKHGFEVVDNFEKPCEFMLGDKLMHQDACYGYDIYFESPSSIKYGIYVDYKPNNQVDSFMEELARQIHLFDIDEQTEAVMPLRGKEGYPKHVEELLTDVKSAKFAFNCMGYSVQSRHDKRR